MGFEFIVYVKVIFFLFVLQHGFATQTVTGYLEVEVNDKLVHSKKV